MGITDDQAAHLLSPEMEVSAVVCHHVVDAMHIHSRVPGGSSAFMVRFAGHALRPGTTETAPVPDADLCAVDVFLSPMAMLQVIVELTTEHYASKVCGEMRQQEVMDRPLPEDFSKTLEEFGRIVSHVMREKENDNDE